MIKNIAWNKQVENIEENLKVMLNEASKSKWNNYSGK